MLNYILQVTLFQLVFLVVYDVFFKRETFFNHNRFYLLSSITLSFILPFIKLGFFRDIAPTNFAISLPEVFIGTTPNPEALQTANDLNTNQIISSLSVSILQIVLISGMLLATLVLIYKIFKIFRLKSKNPQRWRGNILLVKLLKSNVAFSFFNTIFLGEKISEQEKVTIYKHELVHVKQWHSLDLMALEIIKILMWFNPLIYMYQSRIKALHEYIADKNAVKQNGKTTYYKQLLNQIFETNNMSFTNSFFKKSLIKKRIVMLQKSKSKKVNVLKYALMVPVLFGMLFYVSCDNDATNTDDQLSELNLEQYAYEMSLGTTTKTPEVEAIHQKYQSFLYGNKDYVSWAHVDLDNQVISYSVHKKSEQIPDGYTEMTVTNPNGESYIMQTNLGFDNAKVVTEKEKLNPRDYDGKSEVPFKIIDKVPTLAECQSQPTKELEKKCISQTIARFVNLNFDIKLADQLDLVGKQKIYNKFIIDEQGNVIDIKARAPHPDLETEAKRVIADLPKFIPGEHNGKAVKVTYYLPIVFQIKE